MVVTAQREGEVDVDYASPEQVRAALVREEHHSPTEIKMARQRAAQRAAQEGVERPKVVDA